MSATALEAVTTLAARQVLAAAATLLEETYSAARLTPIVLTDALREAAEQLLPDDRSAAYLLAYDAGDVLAEHLRSRGEDPDRLLARWSTPHSTTTVVADLRAAANTTAEEQA